MGAFAGVVASTALFPASSGINAGVYDSRSASLFPYGGAAQIQSDAAGVRAFREPAPLTSARSGNVATSFLQDYYNRIQLIPESMPLGFLATDVQRQLVVWNAHLDTTETLSTIVGSGTTGVMYSGQSAPADFPPNSVQLYEFSISKLGPTALSAVYTFVFANGEAPQITITGTRIQYAWTMRPDWSQPVRESLAWQTDVMRGWSGAEMRRATRISPRRTFTFTVTVSDQDRRTMETVLFALSSSTLALPIFPDGQLLAQAVAQGAAIIPCTTANYDFVAGGLALLMSDAQTFEVVQVDAVNSGSIGLLNGTQNAWGAGTRLYPVRQARLLTYPKVTRESGTVATVSPTFTVVEPCDWMALSGLPVYRTAPVLEFEPDAGSGQDLSYHRDAFVIDNATGFPEVDDRAGLGFPQFSHAWFLDGAASRASFRSLLYLLKGKQGAAWVPSFQLDLLVEADIVGGTALITIQYAGVTAFLNGVQNREDIRIELIDGTVLYRRILSAVAISASLEQVTVDSVFSTPIAAAAVRRVSFMTLCRLSSDKITIDHVGAGVASSNTPFLGVEQPL